MLLFGQRRTFLVQAAPKPGMACKESCILVNTIFQNIYLFLELLLCKGASFPTCRFPR